ncbi:TonB-dependent receptor [Moritella viscosa]|uniref:TonB-dependent receptor n=1 Tax=Moritella viscosa TaxID=80854 RepID=A0A090IDS2_9GAMM|nr:hypothetical protein [Moritella viscosa]CED58817.1 putative exported protein [Moritella viscosa]SGY84446.1 TonB-dependent receptor [Moritella viscosa]SGY85262.1 TonB-dependent receptor [Moritella viscosa]SHN97997.1 TonB-dependent receptor [Moritella viscosa]SHN97998.1 TonB-dependent receptor [Moritella viscosa]
MKTNMTIVALALFSTASFAGTTNISGNYSGTYNLEVRTTDNVVKAKSTQANQWKWDFDNKIVTINAGYIKNAHIPFPVGYAAHAPISLIDNEDGTYTINYVFQAYNPIYFYPKAQTSSTFEITDTEFGLEFKTIDSDADGVIGEAIYGLFPWDIELNWTGSAN